MRMELNGAQVDVSMEGTAGRGVLFLHGWGCSAELMRPAAQVLACSMRTVSPDFPGHGKLGKADPPPCPWGVPDYGKMTAELIEKTALAPCDIVAHSFGARVAIWLAANRPELVGRMVLTGAAGIKKPADPEKEKKTSMYKRLKGAVELAEKTHLFGGLPGRAKEALIQKYGSADYRVLSPEMRVTFNKVIGEDLTELLPKIQAPTLLFWGADDTETPLWMGEKMKELIPDAGLVIEEGTGHFAFAEHSAVFAAVLRSFLTEDR